MNLVFQEVREYSTKFDLRLEDKYVEFYRNEKLKIDISRSHRTVSWWRRRKSTFWESHLKVTKISITLYCTTVIFIATHTAKQYTLIYLEVGMNFWRRRILSFFIVFIAGNMKTLYLEHRFSSFLEIIKLFDVRKNLTLKTNWLSIMKCENYW